MFKVVHKIIVWPISILLLISFFQLGNGDIFCIDEDGYIKVESICMPYCSADEEKSVVNNIYSSHFEHEDSSNCSDVSIGHTFRITRTENDINHQLEISNLQLTKISISHSVLNKNNYINSQSFLNPPNIHQHLHAVTSVVLNC